MDDKISRLIELIKTQLKLAYLDSERWHQKLFSKPSHFETEQRSLVYLYRAARHMDLAYSLYQAYLEDLEHYTITPIFVYFDELYNEVTECVATNHSHQWSITEFNRYRESLYDWIPEARKDDKHSSTKV